MVLDCWDAVWAEATTDKEALAGMKSGQGLKQVCPIEKPVR
jgi:hypothetical protein